MAVRHQARTGSVIMGIKPGTIGGVGETIKPPPPYPEECMALDKSWVENLFTGDQGSAGWVPTNPQFEPVTPHTPIPDELQVPTRT